MNRLKLSKLSEFLSSSGSEFQTVGPAQSNAQQPYVLSRQRGTARQFRLADRRRRRRGAASEAGMRLSVLTRLRVKGLNIYIPPLTRTIHTSKNWSEA